jgi:hypothetical protein
MFRLGTSIGSEAKHIMGTSQGPQTTQTAEATPHAGGPAIVPTPQPNELSSFLAAMANNTLPHIWTLKPDGSPVDPKAFNTSQGTPTWP